MFSYYPEQFLYALIIFIGCVYLVLMEEKAINSRPLTKASINRSAILMRETPGISEDQILYSMPIYEEGYDQLDVVFARWFTWGIRIVIFFAILLAFLVCCYACLKYPCRLVSAQLKRHCYFALLDRSMGRNVKYQRLRRGLEDMDTHLDYETYLLINEPNHEPREGAKDEKPQTSYPKLEL